MSEGCCGKKNNDTMERDGYVESRVIHIPHCKERALEGQTKNSVACSCFVQYFTMGWTIKSKNVPGPSRDPCRPLEEVAFYMQLSADPWYHVA